MKSRTFFIKEFFIYSISILIFINIINAQQPIRQVDPNASCSPYIGDNPDQPLCENRLINSNSIYSTPNSTQYKKRSDISFYSFTLEAINCTSTDIITGLCNKFLGECVVPNITLSQPIVLEAQLCKKSCKYITSLCSNPLVSQFVNCSDDSQFPDNYTLYNLSPYGGSAQYQVPCVDSLTIVSPNRTASFCPFPLFRANRSDPHYDKNNGFTWVGDTSCLVPCPVPIYSNRTWDGIFKMSTIMSSVSFVCVSFNVFTFGVLSREYNKFTLSLLFFSASIWVMNLIDIIYSGMGHLNVFCPEPGKYARQTDLACGITGSFFHLGVVGSLLYWVTMSIQLWASIKRIDLKILSPKNSIIINSIIQIILLVIPLANKSIMAGGGAVSCWVSGKWMQNGVFWFPLSAALGIGTIFILLVIKEIYTIVTNIHHDNRFIKLQIKPFLCVLLIFGSFVYVMATHFYFEVRDDEYNNNAIHYLECLQNNPADECTVDGPPYLRLFFFYFLIRTFGIFVFLLYGLTNKTKKIWINSFIVQYPPIKNKLILIGILGSGSSSSDRNKKVPSNTTAGTIDMETRGYTAESVDLSSIQMDDFNEKD